MAEPANVPSWLLWKVFIPILVSVILGGGSFIAWATPKIIVIEERNTRLINNQEKILDEIREMRKEMRKL